MTFRRFYEADWSILIPSSLLSNKLTPKFLNQFVCFYRWKNFGAPHFDQLQRKVKNRFLELPTADD